MSNRALWRSRSFIWCFNGLWTPAVGPVTARYWVSVIIRSLIVKRALMKRAGSPRGRLRYWRNGSQQRGQLPPAREHTHQPRETGPGREPGHWNVWPCWACTIMMFTLRHFHVTESRPELLIRDSYGHCVHDAEKALKFALVIFLWNIK